MWSAVQIEWRGAGRDRTNLFASNECAVPHKLCACWFAANCAQMRQHDSLTELAACSTVRIPGLENNLLDSDYELALNSLVPLP